MKTNLKYLLTSILFMTLCPFIVDAATLSIEGDSKESTSVYEIKYNPSESPEETINLEVSAVNNNLQYEIKSDYGTCNGLKCTLITATLNEVKADTTIATLTVTNSTAEKQKDNIVLGGTISGASKSIELNASATTTTTTEKVLSNEATLSGINISTGMFEQNFSSDVMEYNITGIKDTINGINITPNCDNNCNWVITCPTGGCSVSNTRKVTLEDGANKVAINVTSEDGTANKTYILNIYKGEVITSSAYLKEMIVKEGKISPNFDSMTNEYSITVGLDVNSLDIITTTEDPNATVLIKGNENLKEGENTITITVTSSDNENKQVYTLLVTKEETEETEEEEKKEEVVTSKVEKKKNYTWLIILLSILGLGLIIATYFIIFKIRKNKKKKNKNKDDSNNNNGSNNEENKTELTEIEKENTETLNILNETRRTLNEEPKQDIDEALDDLMKTKRLELGDLNY